MSLVSKDWHFSSKKIREEIYAKGHGFIGKVDARLFPLVRSFLSSYAKDFWIWKLARLPRFEEEEGAVGGFDASFFERIASQNQVTYIPRYQRLVAKIELTVQGKRDFGLEHLECIRSLA